MLRAGWIQPKGAGRDFAPIDSFLQNDRVLPYSGKGDVCIPAKGRCLRILSLAAFYLACSLMNSSIWTSVISKTSPCAETLSVFKELYISAQTVVAGTAVQDHDGSRDHDGSSITGVAGE